MKLETHDESQCKEQHCCIHNPSNHHMRDWPIKYRANLGIVERICPHGIGHPDPDDIAYHLKQGNSWIAIHGCDGCCKNV